jgi:hypothetical protein
MNHYTGRANVSVIRRWNLNERLGRVAGTNIVEPKIELHLGLQRLEGHQEHVGVFDLDLEALADAGFVTRRVVGNNRVFDVQVYRASSDTYELGAREGQTSALEQFRIRKPT